MITHQRRHGGLLWAGLFLVVGFLAPLGCASDDAATRSEATGSAVASAQGDAPQADGPRLFFWEVTRGGYPGRVYLLGSVHLQSEEGAALDRRVLDVLGRVDEVVFEVDPDIVSPQDIQRITMEKGMYPPHDSLDAHLQPETRALLGEVAPQLGVPPMMLQRMRPWLLSITLVQLQMQREGMSAESGVENLVRKAVDESGRQVRRSAIESVEFQLSLFSDLDPRVEEAMLHDTLRLMREEPKMFDALEAIYRAGDDEALYAMVTSAAEAAKDPSLEAFNKRMFDDRNVGMADAAGTFMAEEQVTFICVGAGHLVGPPGVVALLRNRGYSVTRLMGWGASPAASTPARPAEQAPEVHSL